MNDDEFDEQFKKLFRYMAERFDKIDTVLEAKADKVDIRGIDDRLDGIAARLDDDDTERVALTAQVDRHEGWIHQLADTTKTDLAVDA
jgi:hypothetical protein